MPTERSAVIAVPDEADRNPPQPVECRSRTRGFVREPVLFTLVAFLHLTPIWVFPYVPTQDGPSHLANAVILKDFHSPQARYREWFELRWEPFPNWTSHLLLAGLLFALPPLVAEKVLVSLYVLGFAWSFRYFLDAFSREQRLLAYAGLLFVFNYCFLMGFYNYCLSLVLFWVGLGYCLRRHGEIRPADAIVLAGLSLVAYFTHLLGFLLLLPGAAGMVAVVAVRPVRSLLWIGGAALPSLLLAWNYLLQTGFLASAPDGGDAPSGLAVLLQRLRQETFWDDLVHLNGPFFAPYEGNTVPLGGLVLLLFGVLALVSFVASSVTGPRPDVAARWAVGGVALVLGLLYFLVPNDLGPHGALLKPRLLLLCPLLVLATGRLPAAGGARRLLLGAVGVVLVVNGMLLLSYFRVANREIAQYTAGLSHAGSGRAVRAIQPRRDSRSRADYLWHASCYYCLTTGNVNLHNYEAVTNHFPVRYRRDIQPAALSAEVLLLWESPSEGVGRQDGGWREVYRGGSLRLLTRDEKPD
jgi:hypothetical protein